VRRNLTSLGEYGAAALCLDRSPSRGAARASPLVPPVSCPAAAGSPANEVAELDVERHHAARVYLAGHLGDLAPEVADPGPVEELDLSAFEIARRHAAQVRVVLDGP